MTTRIGPGSRREVGLPAWLFAYAAGRVTGTRPPAVFLTLARTRGLFWGWLHFAGRLMPGGKLPRRETELVILRVAHLAGCEYEWAHHQALGRRAGLSAAEIDRIRSGGEGWSERDAVLLEAVDELHRTRDLTDESWARLRGVLDERRAIELLLLAGHYEMLATTLNTLRLEPDPPRR